jgi:tRNA (guanine37-N1)-methyltransferase
MKIEVVTLFPRMIAGALEFGIVARAIERGLLSVATEDPRAHTADVHRTVDDRPYGGGPGMVMKPEPLLAAIRAAHARLPAGSPRVYLSAQGERFGHAQAQQLAGLPGLLLVAGRYEGVDERVVELGVDRELSVGDYVLSGGELPALTVIDALARLLPGALGDERSSGEDSFAQGLLDWPHYTRPEVFEGRAVPQVLLSGDHAVIRRWREARALERTAQRRPDLLSGQQRAALCGTGVELQAAGGPSAVVREDRGR